MAEQGGLVSVLFRYSLTSLFHLERIRSGLDERVLGNEGSKHEEKAIVDDLCGRTVKGVDQCACACFFLRFLRLLPVALAVQNWPGRRSGYSSLAERGAGK